MINKKIMIVALGTLLALPLTACAGNSPESSSSAPVSSTPEASTSTPESSSSIPGYSGAVSYAAANYTQRAEITGILEKYVLDNHIGGIPFYDDGANYLYNSRLSGLTDTYISNFGFGTDFATPTSDLEGQGTVAYKKYLNTYLTDDLSTLNVNNSKDSVTSDVIAYTNLAYWDVRLNGGRTNYEWKPILAKTDRPIPLNLDANGMGTTWRVKLHANEEGYVYSTLSTNPAIKAFNGRKIALKDYLTPFKATLANQWARSTELCSDSSGFVGCDTYLAKEGSGATFEDTVTGIKLNEAEGSIDFTFNTPKTEFYAMVNLASTLYSPIPEEFIETIGVDKFGIYSDKGIGGSGYDGVDSILSVGAYVPELITTGQQVVLKKNVTSCVAADYHFDGVYYGIYSAAKNDSNYIYNLYKAKKLDVAKIPSSKLAEEKNNPERRLTEGSTTWKFQVNACNQERWLELFGPEGTIAQNSADAWEVKPILSNASFLEGLYYSIDRNELAAAMGRNPAQGFFAGAYMADPENAISYRESDPGKAALEDRYPETCGFNLGAAKELFKQAIADMRAQGHYTTGTASNPDIITLDVEYQDASSVTEEGAFMKKYWEDSFNSIDPSIQLNLDIKAPAIWSDVYYSFCMTGCFDLAFASISGNTLDPLSFLDVCCSDNKAGFTLSWGVDTNVRSDSVVYDGSTWSFDALQAAGTTGAVVKDGVNVPVAESADGGMVMAPVADLAGTAKVTATFDYVVAENVGVTVDHVLWYDPTTGEEVAVAGLVTNDDGNGKLTVTITANGTQMVANADEGYAYGYLEVFLSLDVLGVSTVVEKDVLVMFVLA